MLHITSYVYREPNERLCKLAGRVREMSDPLIFLWLSLSEADVASVNVIDIPAPASLLLGARLSNYPIRLFTDYN